MTSPRTAPPPADTLVILAADLVSKHAERLISELAHAGEWLTLQRLKFALDTYALIRARQIMAESDPQRCTVSDWERAPETTRSAP